MKDPIFRKALKRFELAVRADEMSGAQPPEDRPDIEDEYNSSKEALIKMVEGTPG